MHSGDLQRGLVTLASLMVVVTVALIIVYCVLSKKYS